MFSQVTQQTFRVSSVALLASGGLRSLGMLTLRVEMALRSVNGTGRMTISAFPSLLIGIGLPAAQTHTHTHSHLLNPSRAAACMQQVAMRKCQRARQNDHLSVLVFAHCHWLASYTCTVSELTEVTKIIFSMSVQSLRAKTDSGGRSNCHFGVTAFPCIGVLIASFDAVF